MAAQRRTGTGNGRQAEDDDEPAGLTESARDEILELVNAAVGSQLKRKLPGTIRDALQQPLSEIRSMLESGGGGGRRREREAEPDEDLPDDELDEQPRRGRAQVTQRQPARERRDRADDRQDQRDRGGRDPELVRLQKAMAKMEQEREAERRAARDSERDGMLREHLTSIGVDKNRLRGAVAVLRDSLRYDDKAREWAWISKRDGVDEELDPDVGIREWAATDEGKSYLAPPGAGHGGSQGANAGAPGVTRRSGAGTRVGGQQRAGTTAPSADAKTAKAQQVASAQQQLATAIDSLSGGMVPLG
jgi:hypothetical protein